MNEQINDIIKEDVKYIILNMFSNANLDRYISERRQYYEQLKNKEDEGRD